MTDAIPAKAGVYRIYRLETGDEYVGSSTDLARRWKYHVNRLERGLHHARHLQNAWTKHGAEAFAIEVLELVDDLAILLEREDFHLQARQPIYNHRRIASNNLGVRYSAETCALIRQRVRATWAENEARREQARARALAQWADPEKRARAVAGMAGRTMTDEQKAHLRALNIGKKASDETRAKLSAAHRGSKRGPCPPERREKIAATQRGRPRGWTYTDASRAKLSASLKGKKRTAEQIANWKASRAANLARKAADAPVQQLPLL